MLAHDFTRGGAGDVHGHIAATDHNYLFADGKFVSRFTLSRKSIPL